MTLTSLFEKIPVARYICEKTFTCFILNNGNFRPRAIKTYATTICRREKLKIMNTVVGFEQGTGFFGGSYNIHIYSSSGVVGAAEGHTTDHKIERTVQMRLARSAEVNKKSSNRTRQLPELMSGRLYYYLFCLVVARIRFVQTILSRAAFFVFRNGRKTVSIQVAIRGCVCVCANHKHMCVFVHTIRQHLLCVTYMKQHCQHVSRRHFLCTAMRRKFYFQATWSNIASM